MTATCKMYKPLLLILACDCALSHILAVDVWMSNQTKVTIVSTMRCIFKKTLVERKNCNCNCEMFPHSAKDQILSGLGLKAEQQQFDNSVIMHLGNIHLWPFYSTRLFSFSITAHRADVCQCRLCCSSITQLTIQHSNPSANEFWHLCYICIESYNFLSCQDHRHVHNLLSRSKPTQAFNRFRFICLVG